MDNLDNFLTATESADEDRNSPAITEQVKSLAPHQPTIRSESPLVPLKPKPTVLSKPAPGSVRHMPAEALLPNSTPVPSAQISKATTPPKVEPSISPSALSAPRPSEVKSTTVDVAAVAAALSSGAEPPRRKLVRGANAQKEVYADGYLEAMSSLDNLDSFLTTAQDDDDSDNEPVSPAPDGNPTTPKSHLAVLRTPSKDEVDAMEKFLLIGEHGSPTKSSLETRDARGTIKKVPIMELPEDTKESWARTSL